MRILILTSSTGLAHIVRTFEIGRYLQEFGFDITVACGYGKGRQLASLYRLKFKSIFEPCFQKPKTFGIGTLSAESLLKAYESERLLIQENKPDLVLTDWRFTARHSAAKERVKCMQIWNSNWGLLAGNSGIVNPLFRKNYAAIIQTWAPSFHQFHKLVGGTCRINQIFQGVRNILPDQPDLRYVSKPEQCRCPIDWVGPLVPRPLDWGVFSPGFNLRPPKAAIIFGGHKLNLFKNILISGLKKCGVDFVQIKVKLHNECSQKPFSFFPEALLKCDFAICHGGSDTIYQALMASKPVLVLPQHLEHLDNGKCAESLGVGVCMNIGGISMPQLEKAVDLLISEKVLKKTAKYSLVLRKTTPLIHIKRLIEETNETTITC